MVAPDPDIASHILEVASQVESLAFGAAEFKRAKDEKDAFVGHYLWFIHEGTSSNISSSAVRTILTYGTLKLFHKCA